MSTLRTLQLDAAWRPLEIISVEKGFSMVFTGRAHVVQQYDLGPCPNEFFPSVIVLRRYIDTRRRFLKASRKNIYWRDKYRCQYCGKKHETKRLSLDHVVPKSRGGRWSWENLVTACIGCNQRKGNRTPMEAGMPLLNKPRVLPRSILTLYRLERPPRQWSDFLY